MPEEAAIIVKGPNNTFAIVRARKTDPNWFAPDYVSPIYEGLPSSTTIADAVAMAEEHGLKLVGPGERERPAA